MREILIALVVLTVVCTAFLAAMPWLLRKRNVEMRRTKFGVTLVFDAENADGTPVRLINVNGTFQSGCYVPEDLRFQLACEYHREMARVIEALVAERGHTAEDPLHVLVMGGGYSLPKYLAAYVPEARVDVVEIDPAMTELAREFFFLDEGFGTLDESLVDTVMDTLEKLRSSDFTIGIISHVEELKHRIDSKITVNKATETHGSAVTLSV